MIEVAYGVRMPKRAAGEVIRRSKGRCEARLSGCFGKGTQINHIKSRARMGSHRPINLMNVCAPCHLRITDNKPGTEIYRSHEWNSEGYDENNNPIVLNGIVLTDLYK